MTTIKVDTITNAAGSGAPNIPDGVTLSGTALASANTMDYTESATQPTSPKNGAIWWDTGNDKFFQYMNGSWIDVAYTNPPGVWYGSRGLFAGGNNNSIDYVAIATPGNAQDFGDLTLSDNRSRAACSDGTYGLFGGGNGPSNVIDYVTISTLGNALDFGDLTVARSHLGSCSDGTYGLFAGNNPSNVIDYVTVATPGNATDFGDLTISRYGVSACADATYGVFAGGNAISIDYVTIATPGNASDFGDFNGGYYFGSNGDTSGMGACSDTTRGVFAGAASTDFLAQQLSYITIATPGNATYVNNVFSEANGGSIGACSDLTYGVFALSSATLEYLTIQSLGAATDFGDLTVSRFNASACSGD